MRVPFAAALLAAIIAGCPSRIAAQPKILVNTDRHGVALQGYDPVSYFTGPKPAKGLSRYSASHLGATYRFATAANRDRFVAEPERYVPQFGGYCGFGASRDYLAPIDPEAYTIMNGRLILQNSERVLELWNKEPESRLARADANWPGLVERKGR